MLLTDDEIRQVFDDVQSAMATAPWFIRYAQAIEAAILAKLGAMELPEPEKMPLLVIGLNHSHENVGERSFTEAGFLSAAQEIYKLGQAQAYAQGAAAQLAQEPVLIIRAQDSDIIPAGTKLYTRREA